jgi:PAS domain S-box-containing protein
MGPAEARAGVWRKAMRRSLEAGAFPYLIALASALAAGLLRLLLDPLHVDVSTYFPFFLAAAVSAWAAGLQAGLLAALLGALLFWFFFLPPRYSLSPPQHQLQVALALEFAASAGIAVLVGLLRGALRRRGAVEVEQQERLSELQTLLDVLPVGVAVSHDPRCTDISLNPGFAKLLGLEGYENVSLAGPRAKELPFVASRKGKPIPLEELPMQRSCASGETVLNFEFELCFGDGSTKHLLLNSAPLYDRRGAIRGAIGAVLDISQMKKLEAALRQKAAKLRLIADSLPVLIAYIDRSGRCIFMNRTFSVWFGIKTSALKGMSLEAMLGEANYQRIRPYITEALSGRAVTFEDSLQRAGEAVPVKVTFISHRNAEVHGFFALIEDVSQEVAARERLKASEEHFRLLADNAPVMIWMSGHNRLCTWFNQAWLDFVGRTMEEEKGEGWLENIHPDDVTACTGLYARAFEARRPFTVEYRIRHRSGEYRWVLEHGVPVFSREGQLLRYIGSAVDITEKKEAEERHLREARLKDEFLATLAHELRNPLAPIRSAAENLQLVSPPTPEIAKVKEVIERQVKHLVRLVDDLLDIARVTKGRIMLRKEETDIAAVITHAVETTRDLLARKRQRLSVEVRPVGVDCDFTRLSQVVTNLLINASKYTEDEGQIWLEAGREEDQAVICVRDSGVGIPPEFLPQVFDLFAQGPRTLEHSRGGLGIGLTLVKNLVELHGGTVTAASEGAGKGSKFLVRLPALPNAGAEAEPETEIAAAPGMRRVLVVDDNEDAADMIALALRVQGHDVLTTTTGEDALDLVPQFGPDVILLDIGLPGIDGYEVARRLRAAPEGRDVLLVALTGYGYEEDKQLASGAGFDLHLTKPVETETLVKVMGKRR